VLRRWAERRLYRRTMQIAVSELRRASRTPNALEKLEALEVAEQKLRDAAWLDPEARQDRFLAGLTEIAKSRLRTLQEQAIPAVARLLDAAQTGAVDRAPMLDAAARLLSYLYHYIPDEPAVQELSARFRQLGGVQRPYQAVTPLSEMYRRPPAGAGCTLVVVGLVAALLITLILVR